uniref:Uncharacterized protein n=1 Tax=Plectus sambesii TaxID=2011161 RepID=A0A914UZX8_9BILA
MRRKRRLINAVPRLSKAIEHQINRQQPGRRMGALATGDLAISNALPASDRSDADELDLRIPVGDTPALGALALIPLVAVVAMVLLVMLLLKIRAFHRD